MASPITVNPAISNIAIARGNAEGVTSAQFLAGAFGHVPPSVSGAFKIAEDDNRAFQKRCNSCNKSAPSFGEDRRREHRESCASIRRPTAVMTIPRVASHGQVVAVPTTSTLFSRRNACAETSR